MTFFSTYRLGRFVILASASMGFMLTTISGAGAFTFEGQTEGNSDTRGFTDLQLPGASKTESQSSLSESDKNGIKSGNTTFQFGARPSFDQRYNSNNLFDPYAREGR